MWQLVAHCSAQQLPVEHKVTSRVCSVAIIALASETRKESASWSPQYTTSMPLRCSSLQQGTVIA